MMRLIDYDKLWNTSASLASREGAKSQSFSDYCDSFTYNYRE